MPTFKAVIIRKHRNGRQLRTPFYADTSIKAHREASMFARANKMFDYQITEPVEVFANKPYNGW